MKESKKKLLLKIINNIESEVKIRMIYYYVLNLKLKDRDNKKE